jgi:hypothetical protein
VIYKKAGTLRYRTGRILIALQKIAVFNQRISRVVTIILADTTTAKK